MLLQQEQRTTQTQRIDPKIILANSILQLSTLELAQSIENELLENPALDTMEELGCAGDCIDPSTCPYCSAIKSNDKDEHLEALDSGDIEPEYDTGITMFTSETDEDYDPVGNLEAEMTLPEHLRNQLREAVTAEDFPIGEYIINSLNDRGWLASSVENIALEVGIAESDVCRLLTIIQSFDPPGIAARDLRECLLLQLRFLRDEDLSPADRRINAIAELLVNQQFDHVWAKRYVKLARAAHITMDEARVVVEYIRTRLNPFPASQFRAPWAYRPVNVRSEVRPDVIIRRTELGYEIDVIGAEPFGLCVSPVYRHHAAQILKGEGRHNPESKKNIVESVERAEQFIRNINRRRQTLRVITRCIIDHQIGFLETGSKQFLHPLTRTQVAQMLNMHESIVSRATANKFVQLPHQEVVSFDLFFDSSLSIKDAIEELIHEEDPANPLSDKQIAEILQERGITVARRTIVKYRESQKILSSTRRRR